MLSFSFSFDASLLAENADFSFCMTSSKLILFAFCTYSWSFITRSYFYVILCSSCSKFSN